MNTINKEKYRQLNKANLKQKYETPANKSSQLVSQQQTTIRSTQQTQKFQAKQLKNSISTTYKNNEASFSTENNPKYKQNELSTSMRFSKQNVNNMKSETTLLQSQQISFTLSHQFNKNQKKNSNNIHSTLQQSTNHFLQIRVPQLTTDGLDAFTKKRTSLCQQTLSKQLKSSKSVQFLHPKEGLFQTPTFQNINTIKINQKNCTSPKGEKMKLRDYLFMANISSEVAAKKKRVQRSNSKSNVVDPVKRGLKSCLSQANVLIKSSDISSKYTIRNDEMANILSREIIQEMIRLKSKVDKVQSWLSSAPKSQINQIGPFYLVRRDIQNMNKSFDDIMKKLLNSYPQFQKVNNVKEMTQSIITSKVVNSNLEFTII